METIKLQANLPVTLDKLGKTLDAIKHPIAIIGSINISSDNYNGTMYLYFPEDVFLNIFNSMVGLDETEINEDTIDCAAELSNIILGSAKAEINRTTGVVIDTMLPQIYTKDQIDLTKDIGRDYIIVPFNVDKGSFYMIISHNIQPQKNSCIDRKRYG